MAFTLFQLGAFFISPDPTTNRQNQTRDAVATHFHEFFIPLDLVSGMYKNNI